MISALILSAALMMPGAAQDDLLPDAARPATATALPPQATMKPDTPEAAAAMDTAPLAGAAVSVDAYRRNYEGPKDSSELGYDSGLLSALRSKESRVGNMEGSWVVADTAGRKLLGLELRSDRVVSGRVEGAWRSMLAGLGMNNSGFVSDINQTGKDMEVTYYAGGARSPTILHLTQGGDALWRGYMLNPQGEKTPVTMAQVRMGN